MIQRYYYVVTFNCVFMFLRYIRTKTEENCTKHLPLATFSLAVMQCMHLYTSAAFLLHETLPCL